jgi:hypothetical protein
MRIRKMNCLQAGSYTRHPTNATFTGENGLPRMETAKLRDHSLGCHWVSAGSWRRCSDRSGCNEVSIESLSTLMSAKSQVER